MGRPTVPIDIRTRNREMADANPRWGAPRIHGSTLVECFLSYTKAVPRYRATLQLCLRAINGEYSCRTRGRTASWRPCPFLGA